MRAKFLISLCLLTYAVSWSQSDIGLGIIGSDEKNIIYQENWFANKYERFEPDLDALKNVNERLQNCKIEIFIGLWCRDTKTYLPRFLKLFDSMNIPHNQIKIYNVTKNKKRPRKYVKEFNIKYLPTVIFSNKNGEFGRIVEYPYDTIEKDILQMFKGRGRD